MNLRKQIDKILNEYEIEYCEKVKAIIITKSVEKIVLMAKCLFVPYNTYIQQTEQSILYFHKQNILQYNAQKFPAIVLSDNMVVPSYRCIPVLTEEQSNYLKF